METSSSHQEIGLLPRVHPPLLLGPRTLVGIAGSFVFASVGAGLLSGVGVALAQAETQLPEATALAALAGAPALVLGSWLLTLCVTLVWWGPGLLLALARGRAQRLEPLLLEAGAWSFLAFALAHAAALVLPFAPLAESALLRAAATTLLAALPLCVRAARGGVTAPALGAGNAPRLVALLGAQAVACAWLLPQVYWSDFNPDGVEAFLLGRSLDGNLLPSVGSTRFGLGLGMIPAPFLIHFVHQLLGSAPEAAARIPLLVAVPYLGAGLIALAEHGQARRLGFGAALAVGGAVLLHIAVIGLNAGTYPYYPDLAGPGSLDSFSACFLLGALFFLWDEDRAPAIACSVLAFLGRPNALLVLALFALACLLLLRAAGMRRALLAALALAACAAAALVLDGTALLAQQPVADSLHNSVGYRFRYLRFDAAGRLLFVLLPAGVVPVLTLAWVGRHDALGRLLALLTLGYFGCFGVLAFVSLHQFAPAMLFPVAAFWRASLAAGWPRGALPLAAAATAACFAISLPPGRHPEHSVRRFASQLAVEVGSYRGPWPEHRRAVDAAELLGSLVTPVFGDLDPAKWLAAGPLQLLHYARSAPNGATLYLLRAPDAAAPPGATRIAESELAALYVTDQERWLRERRTAPPLGMPAPAYRIARTRLSRELGARSGDYQLDLRTLLPGGEDGD